MDDWYVVVTEWDEIEGTLQMINDLSDDVSTVSFPHLFDPFIGSNDTIKKLTHISGMKLIPSVLIKCTDGLLFVKYPSQKCRAMCRGFKLQIEMRNIRIAKDFHVDVRDLIITTKKFLHTMGPAEFSRYMYDRKQAESEHVYIDDFEKAFSDDPVEFHPVISTCRILQDDDKYLVHPKDEASVNYVLLDGIIYDDYTDLDIIAKAESLGKDIRFGTGRNYMKGE